MVYLLPAFHFQPISSNFFFLFLVLVVYFFSFFDFDDLWVFGIAKKKSSDKSHDNFCPPIFFRSSSLSVHKNFVQKKIEFVFLTLAETATDSFVTCTIIAADYECFNEYFASFMQHTKIDSASSLHTSPVELPLTNPFSIRLHPTKTRDDSKSSRIERQTPSKVARRA